MWRSIIVIDVTMNQFTRLDDSVNDAGVIAKMFRRRICQEVTARVSTENYITYCADRKF